MGHKKDVRKQANQSVRKDTKRFLKDVDHVLIEDNQFDLPEQIEITNRTIEA